MRLAAFIPRFVNNRIVLSFLEVIRFWQKTCHIGWKSCRDNLANNAGFQIDGMIENQRDLAHIRFGKTNMSYSGCEIIAVHNTLVNMNKQSNLAQLIHIFEQNGMVFSGKFGTSPRSIARFFKKNGYEVSVSTKPKLFDNLARNADNLILTMYNNGQNIMEEIHSICITRDEEGFYGHNVYGNGRVSGPEETVSKLIESINGGHAKGILLISIKEKD